MGGMWSEGFLNTDLDTGRSVLMQVGQKTEYNQSLGWPVEIEDLFQAGMLGL